MTQTIDVTGLSAEAVHAVESLIDIIRKTTTRNPVPGSSIFDLFGKAPQLRSGADIEKQIQDERNDWDKS